MGDLLCDQNTPNRPIRHRWKSRLALARLNICRRCALSISNWAQGTAIAEVQRAELGLANAQCVFQGDLEYRLELTGR